MQRVSLVSLLLATVGEKPEVELALVDHGLQ
jgi:hypothetical protein